jgi:hypothetical protein
MINNIGEGTLRAATKIDPSAAIHDRQATQEKTEILRQARPVESSESEGKAKAKSQDDPDDSQSKYILDNNTIVFEKYNKDGDLVYRVPPSYKPVDERA